MGSFGDSSDDPLAETINGLYKAEVIHRQGPWRSFEAIEYATFQGVNWFNNRRLHRQYPRRPKLRNYYAMPDDTPMAALSPTRRASVTARRHDRLRPM